MSSYDVVVVGAGIAGAATAYHLTQAGLSVAVVERHDSLSCSASAAAGAFLSGKIGKPSPLHRLTNEAFEEASSFYSAITPDGFDQSGLVRLSKDQADSERFELYSGALKIKHRTLQPADCRKLNIDSQVGIVFEQGGVCDPDIVIASLLDGSTLMLDTPIESISNSNNLWHLSSKDSTIVASKVVLASGYSNGFCDEPYLSLTPQWGSRGRFATSRALPMALHKDFSISASATHEVTIGATNSLVVPDEDLAARLLEALRHKATSLWPDTEFELLECRSGMRSNAKDHFPIAGRLIDAAAMIEQYPNITKGAKAPLHYYDNLFVINGMGARGFVFAPMVSRMLTELIVADKPIDSRVDSERLFWRWVRRLR